MPAQQDGTPRPSTLPRCPASIMAAVRPAGGDLSSSTSLSDVTKVSRDKEDVEDERSPPAPFALQGGEDSLTGKVLTGKVLTGGRTASLALSCPVSLPRPPHPGADGTAWLDWALPRRRQDWVATLACGETCSRAKQRTALDGGWFAAPRLRSGRCAESAEGLRSISADLAPR